MKKPHPARERAGWDCRNLLTREDRVLLLPGALLMAMGAQLLAPLVLINLRFSTFL